MSEVGNRLKALRDGVKLSQGNIADKVGMAQASINRYEKGLAEAPYRVLMWYADYFDVSMDYIFGRCDKPQGKLYEYKPVFNADNEELKHFIEMCFDPTSAMNERLKETLLNMMGGENK